MRLDISEIATDFPEFRVGMVVASDLAISALRSPELATLIERRRAATIAAWGGRELGEIPGISVWRLAYKRFGIKSTRYRCSVERLVKNALAERDQPEINTFVDAYNAVSLTHVFPIGADDLDLVEGDVSFRYARMDDSFLDMAGGGEGTDAGPVEDPPKPGEVVYADAAKVLCRRWNWRQDGRSLVQPTSRRVILTIQSLGVGDLDAALADLCDLTRRFSGGRTSVSIADASNPTIEI